MITPAPASGIIFTSGTCSWRNTSRSRANTTTTPQFGSTLDTEKGVFSWMVHPVFHGEYELVFTMNEAGKPVSKKVVRVMIGKEGDNSRNSLEACLSGGNYASENSSLTQASPNKQSYARLG